MVGSFLDVFFLLLPVILSDSMGNQKGMIGLQKKYTVEFV